MNKEQVMKREKVVCFLNHTAETGGAEFALLRLVTCMDRSEWHPVVVFGEDGPAVELFRQRSIETYVILMDAGLAKLRRESLASIQWLKFSRIIALLSYVLKLIRFFRERAVEIVHTNSMKAHVLGGVAAKISGVPLVWHLRDSLHPACLPPVALRGMRFFARSIPDKLITVSKSVAMDALGCLRCKSASVVYDGVLRACFKEPRAIDSSHNAARRWTIGMAGRLSEWKGQHLFIEAAARMIEQGARIRCEIMGSPLFGQEAYAQRLKQFVEANGLGDQIQFLGFVSDVPARLRTWDLLVHASIAPDPCPNVVIEAMAAGVPVVGPNEGGVPELLEDGTCGFLFNAGDARSLGESIELALSDSSRRGAVAALARKKAESDFQADRVAREIEAIWMPLITPKAYARRKWPWIEDWTPLEPINGMNSVPSPREAVAPGGLPKSKGVPAQCEL